MFVGIFWILVLNDSFRIKGKLEEEKSENVFYIKVYIFFKMKYKYIV